MLNLSTDIEALCADRPEDAAEMFAPNSWYGAARTIRNYTGWTADRPLPIVMPHGIELSTEFVYAGEINNMLPAIYSFPPFRDQIFQRATDKRVVPGCSSWLYLPKPNRALGASGCILVMPAHSIGGVDVEMDDDSLARLVRDRYQGEQITCCMYWRDIQLERHKHYLKHGIQVVTAGHIFDPLFAERLAAIFVTAKLMITNDLSSHVYYAASSGVPVVLLSEVRAEWPASPEVKALYFSVGSDAAILADTEHLFRTSTPDIVKQRQMADTLLGIERMMSASELRALLEELWLTPGFRTRAVPLWRLRRRTAPVRMLLRKLAAR